MTVLPNKLIIQTIFKTHSHHCKTKSAGDYMVDTYISMKLTLLSDLFFSLSFSTSGTVSIGTVLSMLFVRYLVLLHPSSNIRLLLKPNLYLQWFTLQTNQNEFSIDWWLTHNKGGYILWSSKVGWVTTGASWLSQFQKIALKLIPIVFEITVIGSFTDDHILNEKCKSSTRTGEES